MSTEEAEAGEWVSPESDALPVPVNCYRTQVRWRRQYPHPPAPEAGEEPATSAPELSEQGAPGDCVDEVAEDASNPFAPRTSTTEPEEREEQSECPDTQEETSEMETKAVEISTESENVAELVTEPEEPEAQVEPEEQTGEVAEPAPAPATGQDTSTELGETHTSKIIEAHDPYEEIAAEYGIKSEDFIDAFQVYIATMTTPPEPLRKLALKWLWNEDLERV